MIFQTSGTTETFKKFELSWEDRITRAERLPTTLGPEFLACDHLVVLLPVRSTALDKFKIYCNTYGVTYHSTTDVLADVPRGDTVGLIGSPATLLVLSRRHELTKYHFIKSGGDRLEPADAIEIRDELLAPNGLAIATYGASEVGTICRATFSELIQYPGCVGRPLPGVSINIHVNGDVAVQTPTMIKKYKSPWTTRKYFLDGWFYPCDKGYWQDDLLILRSR